MLFVTSTATAKLSLKLCKTKTDVKSEVPLNVSEKVSKNIERFRVRIIGGGCSGYQYKFSIDKQHDDEDIVLVSDALPFEIIVDKHSFPLINGSTLDHSFSLGGEHFYIKNPQAKANCGCGNSFSV